ncbi:MAG TPA: sugar phosphate isomerase/epimerase [Actinomycetota bacterium]|nr:sugar phosphate isomerase/epimerase [Actinomycetota bacterium]
MGDHLPEQAGPTIACSTGSFWMWDLERTFGTIAEAGFDAIELMVTRDPRTQSARVPQDLARRDGLRFIAVHAPMLVVTRRVWGPNSLRIIDRSVDLAKQLGTDLVVVHPPLMWDVKYQAWLLGDLDTYERDREVTIGVENMFHVWVRGRAVKGYRWLSPTEVQQFPNVTLDTSHCAVDGSDILASLDTVAPKLAHIHLSDSHCDHRDNHALPGSGVLPLDSFLRRLPDVGYRGTVALELDLRGLTPEPKKLLDALRRARDYCLERTA